ncbi:DUF2510 domain-containing protein [Nocardioides sp.]|uniref:DUF2510 domain-containing protein n=1 Tax=Nocardioides sp. TaxID=35761 RepID=UPI0032193DF8
MAAAGWYPDPSGQPGAFRYWDGDVWSETLADTPYGPPPGGLAPPPPPPTTPLASTPPPVPTQPIATSPPPPPGGFDQPTVVPGGSPPGDGGFQSYAAIGPLGPPSPSGWQGQVPPPPSSPGNGSGRTVGLMLVAVALTLLLGIATFFVVGALVDDDDPVARSTASPAPSPEPTPQPDDPTPTPQASPQAPPTTQPTDPGADGPSVLQCTGGLPEQGVTGERGRFITGGGLRVPKPADYETALDQGPAFTFADGVFAPSKIIEQGLTSGWVATYALGSLSRGNGFESPRQAAEVVVQCMAGSASFYSDFTGSTELDSTERVVDGAPAWELTQEIRIDDPELSVEGDVAKVVVVDTGDPSSYGLFVSVVPIGDQAMIDAQDEAVGDLEIR